MSSKQVIKKKGLTTLIVFCHLIALNTYGSRGGIDLKNGEYPQVVSIQVPSGNGGHSQGSGVLIADDIVISVRHVMPDTPIHRVQINTGYKPSPHLGSIEAYGIDFRVLSTDDREDIVVIKLDKKLPFKASLTDFYRDELIYGMDLEGVGYGVNTYVNSGGLKRKSNLIFSDYKFIPKNESQKNDVEGFDWEADGTIKIIQVIPGKENQILCSGDSGGGVFVKRQNGQKLLVGLTRSIHRGWDQKYALSRNPYYLCEVGKVNRLIYLQSKIPAILEAISSLKAKTFPISDDISLKFNTIVPMDIRKKLLDSLKWALKLKGPNSTKLFQRFFGEKILDGQNLVKYIVDNIKYITIDPNYTGNGVARVKDGVLSLNSNTEHILNLELIDIFAGLVHEAKHMQDTYGAFHSKCPERFIDDAGNPLMSHISNQKLQGKYACDIKIDSAYGLQYTMLRNIALFCTTCTEKEIETATSSGEQIILRITNMSSKRKLLSDM